MFELSVALKYLVPRRRQLSVSIISTISVLVIALVVWLILVFFSVTNGLEKVWIQKLTSLTAPARLTPTQSYFQSYYHQVDSLSAASDYSYKSLGEKRIASLADPYDPQIDEEIPQSWPEPDREEDGSVKDIVKKTFSSIGRLTGVPGLTAREFEIGFSNIQLQLIRPEEESKFEGSGIPSAYSPSLQQSLLNHSIYLGSFDPDNATLKNTLLPLSMEDLSHLFESLSIRSDGNQEISVVSSQEYKSNLRRLFDYVTITELKTAPSGWVIPSRLLPEGTTFSAFALEKNGKIIHVFLPEQQNHLIPFDTEGYEVKKGSLIAQTPFHRFIAENSKESTQVKAPISIPGNQTISVHLVKDSLGSARKPEELQFTASIVLQGKRIEGKIPYRGLKISQADIQDNFQRGNAPFWVYQVEGEDGKTTFDLPKNGEWGSAILLPRSFREVGLLVGDRGFLSYYSPTATSLQEQRVPVYVAGFFDPGVVPIGGKFALALPETLAMIRQAQDQGDWSNSSSGINIRFDDIAQADYVKSSLAKELEKEGLSRYWHLETFREYEFTKNLLQQLKSDKNLFSLISIVIIIVACSNIISMLIILVNDKKVEIGILRAMGASSKSIAAIFAFCGVIMGTLGSLLGISFALLTLHYLPNILEFMGKLQGHDVFNAMYFGTQLPTDISYEALIFVMIATVLISLLAGTLPAIKASLLRPSAILRSE